MIDGVFNWSAGSWSSNYRHYSLPACKTQSDGYNSFYVCSGMDVINESIETVFADVVKDDYVQVDIEVTSSSVIVREDDVSFNVSTRHCMATGQYPRRWVSSYTVAFTINRQTSQVVMVRPILPS